MTTFFSRPGYRKLQRNFLPRAKNVEELRQSLLYNNTLEIWMALCTERGMEWRSIDAYSKFLDHLGKVGVKLRSFGGLPPDKGFLGKTSKGVQC